MAGSDDPVKGRLDAQLTRLPGYPHRAHQRAVLRDAMRALCGVIEAETNREAAQAFLGDTV